MPKQQFQSKRPYYKISQQNKDALKTLVFHQGFSIKQAAHTLSINYTSAKTTILQFRKSQKRRNVKYLSMKPCLVKEASKYKYSLKIISQTGGVKVDEKDYCLR
ncbi:unnamed protein product [Paramecium octaurelia]|uniref:Uncharacterized protein n=1 Tax=Paramecium octaurelia TaxID=43137 RepID=A0A8S1VTX0_PAROT|nr:unnamed protein product [Paramecium octaurelia]